jgi:hypothetical protein
MDATRMMKALNSWLADLDQVRDDDEVIRRQKGVDGFQVDSESEPSLESVQDEVQLHIPAGESPA